MLLVSSELVGLIIYKLLRWYGPTSSCLFIYSVNIATMTMSKKNSIYGMIHDDGIRRAVLEEQLHIKKYRSIG